MRTHSSARVNQRARRSAAHLCGTPTTAEADRNRTASRPGSQLVRRHRQRRIDPSAAYGPSRCEPGRFAVRSASRPWLAAPAKVLRQNKSCQALSRAPQSSDAAAICTSVRRAASQPGGARVSRGKRKWASSLTREQAKAGFKGWHERGYLPHRDEPGLTQMVTFHVADSFPAALRSEWAALLEIEDGAERRKKLQAYLDWAGGMPVAKPTVPGWWMERSAFTTAPSMTCAPGWSCPTTSMSCSKSPPSQWGR